MCHANEQYQTGPIDEEINLDRVLNAIAVSVETHYIAEQSAPAQNRFVFAYSITIRNDGEQSAQLLSRHWIITDGEGRTQEVRGDGVVGEQPYLRPGESFHYTSGTVLDSPVGTMQGSYQMMAEDGQRFEAPIAPFTLAIPRTLH